MKVYFWGTRGSLPASFRSDSIREKIFRAIEAARDEDTSTPEAINRLIDKTLPFSVKNTYGINTPCIEIITCSNEFILCDAGSGLRDFSDKHVRSGAGNESGVFHLFMSHLHWDHIQGFPFFAPIYKTGNRVVIHGYHERIPEIFQLQMSAPCFPVDFASLPAEIEFDIKDPCEPFQVADIEVTGTEQQHPGKSYGFRFSQNGKVAVYSTDSEHKEEAYETEYPFTDFISDADLLIFDAMYSLADATFHKADWGHSSNVMGVEIASRAKVKHLCMFHNEPTASDSDLDEFLFNTRMYGDIYHSEQQDLHGGPQFPKRISLAFDGLEIEI